MYTIRRSGAFRKDYKRAEARGCHMTLLFAVLGTLAKGGALDQSCDDHLLAGRYNGCRECHIKADWLLIYRLDKKSRILELRRTGTHSDLF
jgi:mRNA interferase YafQ